MFSSHFKRPLRSLLIISICLPITPLCSLFTVMLKWTFKNIMHSNLFSKLPSLSLDILSEFADLPFPPSSQSGARRSPRVKVWHPVLSLPRKYSIDRPGAVVLCCQGGRDSTDFSGYLGNCETLNACLCGVCWTQIQVKYRFLPCCWLSDLHWADGSLANLPF